LDLKSKKAEKIRSFLSEATMGFEPMMRVLQTLATLPPCSPGVSDIAMKTSWQSPYRSVIKSNYDQNAVHFTFQA
jgi:hypothetical protein